MSQFDEALNQILSDPNTMGQLMRIASSLSGGDGENQSVAGEKPPTPPAVQQKAVDTGAENPRSDPLSALLGGTGQGLMAALGTGQQNEDEKAALLSALRPFLRPERAARVDRVIQLLRLSRMAKAALTLLRKEVL